MKLNENGCRKNKSEICYFDQKENDKKIYILKSDERIVIHCSHESNTQTGENKRFGNALFWNIQVWKILIQFSYHYDSTVTDVISHVHKIVIIPNLGRTTPFRSK